MTFVSVITSTYNRFRFIPRLIEIYKSQTYPHDQMEWIILDDGDEKTGPLFAAANLPNIRYISLDTKLQMGAKLNRLKQEARGDITIVMDDDDYYPPTRVETAVKALQKNPTILVAGASKVYLYYTDTDEIYCAGPYHDKHALNCTMAWRTAYAQDHAYDDEEPCAVESAFLDNFTSPMVQLKSRATILHIIHSSNSFNAIKARNHGQLGFKTALKLTDFMPQADAVKFVNAY